MIVAIGLTLPAGFGVALAAEERSAGEIIKALKPERLTRGLTTSPADAARNSEEAKFVNTLRNRPTRSLTTAEREQITSIAQKRPSIDLEVNFDYNSDPIGSKGIPQFSALVRYCCKIPKLLGDNFPVVRRFDRRPPISAASNALPRSPVSLSSGDEVPHIFT